MSSGPLPVQCVSCLPQVRVVSNGHFLQVYKVPVDLGPRSGRWQAQQPAAVRDPPDGCRWLISARRRGVVVLVGLVGGATALLLGAGAE
jgi:hypothetical protein